MIEVEDIDKLIESDIYDHLIKMYRYEYVVYLFATLHLFIIKKSLLTYTYKSKINLNDINDKIEDNKYTTYFYNVTDCLPSYKLIYRKFDIPFCDNIVKNDNIYVKDNTGVFDICNMISPFDKYNTTIKIPKDYDKDNITINITVTLISDELYNKYSFI